MVKIEHLTKEEIELSDKKDRLVEIAKDFFRLQPERVNILRNWYIGIKYSQIISDEYAMVVNPKANFISVRSRLHFDEAKDLAKRYEQEFPNPEWIVKTQYRTT